MRSIRSLLVLLDGTRAGESCVPAALALARRAGARVTLVAVRDPEFPEERDPRLPVSLRDPDDPPAADLAAYLDAVRRRIGSEYPDPRGIECVVLDGPVGETLAEHVARTGAELVAFTRRGSAVGVGRLVDALLGRSDVAVLAVPPADRGTPPVTSFRHVLLPIGWTLERAPGTDTAVTAVGVEGVTFTVLRLAPPLPHPVPGVLPQEEIEEMTAPERAMAEQDRAEAERLLRERGADVRGLVRYVHYPAQAALEVAREIGADLIAVASCRHTPGSRPLLGTVAGELAISRDVAVLVRHVGERDGDGRARDVAEQRRRYEPHGREHRPMWA
jgi:nucleotide-binding universal stress UspA family protein